MLNHLKSDKQVTHEQILEVMFETDTAVESLPAVAAIMGHVFRFTGTLTIGDVVSLFSQGFDALDDMMTDADREAAVTLLNRIVEL